MRAVLAVVLASACGFGPVPSSAPGTGDAGDDALVDGPPDAIDLTAPNVLAGQRWLLPCTNNLGNHNCNCVAPQMQTATVPGDGTKHYMVTVRIRGAMEQITYTGGSGVGGWYIGGFTADTADNIYRMDVSSPPQHYFLNNGVAGCTCSMRYDYTASFPIDGGAAVTFTATGQDTLQWGNYDSSFTPITFSGITTTPDPYDGQFAQLDVVMVTLIE